MVLGASGAMHEISLDLRAHDDTAFKARVSEAGEYDNMDLTLFKPSMS